MLRPVFFALLLASFVGAAPLFAQNSAPYTSQETTGKLPADSGSRPVPEEVAAAEAAIAKSDWKAAEAKLDPWVVAHPVDARALFDSGYVADAEDRLDDAAKLYRRAVEANPQSFEAHVSLGLLLARQGKATDARPELAAATKLDPGEAGPGAKAQAWRALAEIDRTSDPAAASEDLLQALKISPETEADTLMAAGLADQAGQLDTAEAAYRRVLAKDPKSAAANAGLAHVMITRKQYPEAEDLLRTALEQSPDNPAMTAQLATVLAAEDKAEALPLIQKLHGSHPKDAAITRVLAEVLAQAGDAAGSDRLYVELLAAAPEDPVLLVAHGQNLIRQLKYGEAFAIFDKATKLDPASGDGWSGLAFAASKTAHPSVALRALTMRAKYLPEVPATYFLWATSYDSLHNKAEAISYYHHFLESSAGKFPDQEWQCRQRLILLENRK